MSEVIDRIQRLTSELREEGVSISPAELVETVQFVSKYQINSLKMLKSLLRINLIKHQDQFVLFDVLFEKYFPEFYGKIMDLTEVESELEEIEEEVAQNEQEKLKTQIVLEQDEAELEGLQQIEEERTLSSAEASYKEELEESIEKLEERYEKAQQREEILNKHKDILEQKLQMQEKLSETLEEHKPKMEEYFQQLEKQEEELEEVEQEVKEELDTQELCVPPEKFDEKERKHGGEERHREVETSGRELEETQKSTAQHKNMEQQLQEQQSKVEQFEPSKEEEEAGRGEGEEEEAIGKEGKASLGVRGRGNANLQNNSLLREVMNRFREAPVGEKQFAFNVLNSNLEMAKATILKHYRVRALKNKEMLKKGLDNYIKKFREAILSANVPMQEKREIYHELLNRISKLQQYNYQKELLKKYFLNKPKGIANVHFKDLQHIYEDSPEFYDVVMNRMKKYVLQLSRVFRNKKGLRYRKAKAGSLDVARTISYNLTRYGDEIGELKYRKRKFKKTNFFVLCDVSYSVDHVTELFMSFLKACGKVFNKLIIYLFVDHIQPLPKIDQYAQVCEMLGGYSNMRIAFYELAELRIPKDFTILILTDCRTNNYDERESALPYSYESLLDVRNQVNHILILNPEPKEEWGVRGGGGSALMYMNHSKVPIMEFYNLECFPKLIKVLEKIT